jgi:hypothetical protein
MHDGLARQMLRQRLASCGNAALMLVHRFGPHRCCPLGLGLLKILQPQLQLLDLGCQLLGERPYWARRSTANCTFRCSISIAAVASAVSCSAMMASRSASSWRNVAISSAGS